MSNSLLTSSLNVAGDYVPGGNTIIGLASSVFGSFGDTPDHDRAKVWAWAQAVAAGQAALCPQGTTVRDATHAYGGSLGVIRKGERVQFDVAEVVRALQAAPRGRPHDPPGSYEGLRTAVAQPMLDEQKLGFDVGPLMQDNESTARLAVGVAHGRLDCEVGWQEEPTVVHLRVLVTNYRSLPQPPAPTGAVGGQISQALEGTGVTPLQAGLGLIGLIALLRG